MLGDWLAAAGTARSGLWDGWTGGKGGVLEQEEEVEERKGGMETWL